MCRRRRAKGKYRFLAKLAPRRAATTRASFCAWYATTQSAAKRAEAGCREAWTLRTHSRSCGLMHPALSNDSFTPWQGSLILSISPSGGASRGSALPPLGRGGRRLGVARQGIDELVIAHLAKIGVVSPDRTKEVESFQANNLIGVVAHLLDRLGGRDRDSGYDLSWVRVCARPGARRAL